MHEFHIQLDARRPCLDPQRIARFITEDIIAIGVTTDVAISPEMVGVVVVALPFAVLLELVVDHPAFGYFEQLVKHALLLGVRHAIFLLLKHRCCS
jgi:hypothetical protein